VPLTLRDYLDVVEPFIPPALVPVQSYARIRDLAACLPPAGLAGFECWLGSEQPRADFAVAVPAEARDLQAKLAATDSAYPLLAQQAWAPVVKLCRQWLDPASPLHDTLSTLWLEFDFPPDRQSGSPDAEGARPNVLVTTQAHRTTQAELHTVLHTLTVDRSRP